MSSGGLVEMVIIMAAVLVPVVVVYGTVDLRRWHRRKAMHQFPGRNDLFIDIRFTEQQLRFLDELLSNVGDMQARVSEVRNPGKKSPIQVLTESIQIRITAALAGAGRMPEV